MGWGGVYVYVYVFLLFLVTVWNIYHEISFSVFSNVSLEQSFGGGGGGVQNGLLVVCWARCPVLCSIIGSILLCGEFFLVEGIFPLELTWVLIPIAPNFQMYKPKSSLCTYAFHRTDSKYPDIHVLDGWVPAPKTHPACTIHEDGMWLPQWLD